MRRSLLGAVVVSAFLLGSCSGGRRSESHSPQGSGDFAAFAAEYFRTYFVFNPSEGTSVGYHQFDTQIEDRSATRIQSRISELQRQLAQAGEFRKRQLSPDDAI